MRCAEVTAVQTCALPICLLHPVEHHDRQQRANVQRGGSAVEPNIRRDPAVARARVERLGLGDLVNESPARQNMQIRREWWREEDKAEDNGRTEGTKVRCR